LEGVFTFDLEQKTRQPGLPNLDLKSRHKHFRMAPSFDLGGISRLEEEFDGLLQIRTSGLDAVALARNIELWTESNLSIALAFNNSCELLHPFHWACSSFQSKTTNFAAASA
jgi:hypothetical protein